MAFNINDFSSNIKKFGTLKNNNYEVIISLPIILKNINVRAIDASQIDIMRVLNFRTEKITLPGFNLELQPVNRYGIGPKQRFPTNVVFPETISMTFLETEQNDVHRFFTIWMNSIFNFQYSGFNNIPGGGPNGLYLTEYKDNYATDITIKIYNGHTSDIKIQPAPINEIVLKGAFPTQLSELSLDWSDTNTVMKINVTFTFSDIYSPFHMYTTADREILIAPPPG